MNFKTPAEGRLERRVGVLLADDSARVRRMLRGLLAASPRLEIVGEAKDGIEAIHLIQELSPAVIVLDIQMPRLGGVGVLETIRSKGWKCQTIVLTNHSSDPYRQSCLRLGANYFFDKVFDLDSFLQTLEQLS